MNKPSLLVSDATLNNSNKVFTVPANKRWQITSVRAILTSTATAGNRQIQVSCSDGGTFSLVVNAGVVQAASLTRDYTFAAGLADLTAFRNTQFLTNPLPVPEAMVFNAGSTVRVLDAAVVDAAADDMTVLVYGYEEAAP